MSSEDFQFGDALPELITEIAPERWVRVREEIVFRDLVEELLSKAGLWRQNGSAISCPFHGSDCTPSFNFYDSSNSAFCFGCPPPKQNQTYDSINFVSKYFGISKVKALEWIEKHYKLPFIADVFSQVEDADEDDEVEVEPAYSLTVKDLKPLYLSVAPSLIESVGDARALIKKYFIAESEDDPLFLARVLGRKRLESIKGLR